MMVYEGVTWKVLEICGTDQRAQDINSETLVTPLHDCLPEDNNNL